MATKTFKIGLSDADKLAMSQTIYEQVEALLFDEYDSSKTYDIGDYTVYNSVLYRCIVNNTTGTWNVANWEQATLQDLVDDVNGAVETINDKANVDGNYPTMTVGFADNLTPYDENNGDDQDEPFSFEATGTANGSQSDFATDSKALLNEKQGNSVVVNQLVQNPNFASTSNWQTSTGATFSVSNNIATFTASSENQQLYQNKSNLPAHTYLAVASIKLTTANTNICLSFHGVDLVFSKNTTDWQILTAIRELPDATSTSIGIKDTRSSGWDAIQIKNVCLIDLTQWFGSNSAIPPDLLDHPENFFRYYQGSLAYNTGTIVDSNGRYIKCIGMNQWDEEWELGAINSSGTLVDANNQIRSKNYCAAIPNAPYCLNTKSPASAEIQIFWYDENYNFISGYYTTNNNQTTIAPSNAKYFKIRKYVDYGAIYNHDVSINLYYEKSAGVPEPRCLTYEPYEVLTNTDTGTEVLRSAGSVKDVKLPDGTITRNVGSVDLGTLSWTDAGSNYYTADLTGIKGTTSDAVKMNAICSSYQVVAQQDISTYLDVISLNYNTIKLYVHKSSEGTPTGTLYYELATPTTEQGTSFSPNLDIDDFGSMSFEGTNGVPQGNLIFYPVDYKAFVDTLFNYTEGTPSNIALNSELSTKFETYLKSLTGYDDTKTQSLKNVSGTLTWVDDE